MCPSLVEIRSLTSRIRRQKRKKEEKTTAAKYKPFGIAIPCGLITKANMHPYGIKLTHKN